MELFELIRNLVDIESITENEEQAGNFLFDYLSPLAARYGGTIERMPVEPRRFNVLAWWGEPRVTLSTHLDTVPPFFPSREDGEYIWGRGSCDAKGIAACMVKAAEALLADGVRDIALLFVVGEERNSAGAHEASRHGRGSRYLINGEPTENRLALGCKGALRYEFIARGRMAHSAYPHLGESAINKLLDVLQATRAIPLPVDELLGGGSLNIGTIQGGRAPNVIADEARAEVMFRLVADSAPLRAAIEKVCAGKVEAHNVLEIPALKMEAVEGIETAVMAYTTDIPEFKGQWGRPLLLGPGTIHVAHTSEERVPKRELLDAVNLYQKMVRHLLTR
ncbi:MAG: M20/M25/M40 family metallo-hydrolase [Bryobacterales bacterium]|nr:M20/M25/M40 family metallo-hydrolase [Bryobacterales bacterium]